MKNDCERFSGPHTHIRTRTLACLMNWLDGGARAPDMSKGKGNHCKSHSVTCASFWKKKYPGFFLWPLWFPPHFGSGQTLLHTHHPFLHLRVCFFLPYPPADIHSSLLTFRLKGFFYHYSPPPLKYLKLLLGFVRVWSGDLEMKTDSPLICRIWIGIACASGEHKFYWEKLGAQKLMNAKLGVYPELPFSWKLQVFLTWNWRGVDAVGCFRPPPCIYLAGWKVIFIRIRLHFCCMCALSFFLNVRREWKLKFTCR